MTLKTIATKPNLHTEDLKLRSEILQGIAPSAELQAYKKQGSMHLSSRGSYLPGTLGHTLGALAQSP